MRINSIAILLVASWLSVSIQAQAIEFERDIQPILTQHCISCHGADRAESGLSLHSYEAVLRGGDSGKPILGGTVQTNEILRRINSTDPLERMPLEAQPLPPESIEKMHRWVEQGSPWPVPIAQTSKPALKKDLSYYVNRFVKPYLPWLVGLLIVVVLFERVKVLSRKRAAADHGRLAWGYALANRVTLPIYLIAFLCVVLGILIDQTLLLQRLLEKAREQQIVEYDSGSITSVFGQPPVPIRPSHEPRLGGTYYRGNSERNAALYNNGNYRTATLELALIDSSGQTVDYDHPFSGELSIQLVINSAPGATPVLFSDDIMAGLLLAPGYHPEGMTVFTKDVGAFEPTAQPNQWKATFSLKDLDRDPTGLIYLYRGKRDDDGNIHVSGMPQLGIVYDLQLKDRTITSGSELWMDAIYFPEGVAPPPKDGKLPWTQWFDYQPIPIIEGENVKDPTLLGITEDPSQETK